MAGTPTTQQQRPDILIFAVVVVLVHLAMSTM